MKIVSIPQALTQPQAPGPARLHVMSQGPALAFHFLRDGAVYPVIAGTEPGFTGVFPFYTYLLSVSTGKMQHCLP